MLQKLGSFVTECKRVLQITKKPGIEEFKATVKISALGILLIGGIGFALFVGRIVLLSLLG